MFVQFVLMHAPILRQMSGICKPASYSPEAASNITLTDHNGC